jgi:hypothetical protein
VRGSGSSRIELNVKAKAIEIPISGSCRANLEGSVETCVIKASGSVKVKAYNMTAKKVDLTASGAVFTGFAAGVVDPAFGSIAPEVGQQEETLTGVQISCFNTTFLDGFSINIQFNPGPSDKFTVSNVRALSNTLLEFDLTIATDAPLGSQSVTVSYGDPTTSVTGNAVFEVQ